MKKIVILFVLLIVSSCNSTSTEALDWQIDQDHDDIITAYPPLIDYNDPYPINEKEHLNNIKSPTPEVSDGGLTTVHGQIFLENDLKLALSNTLLYLTPGKGEDQSLPRILIGPEIDKGDYAILSDNNAYFSFKNVKPGTYYLVVSSTNSFSIVEADNQPLKIVVSSEKVINLKKLFVDLP